MVVYALIALIAGVLCGRLAGDFPVFEFLLHHSETVLNFLMFSVGVSIGFQKGVFAKIRQYHIKALIIPALVIVGSFAGGLIGCAVTGYPLAEGTAIASCMGWYSLGGITIEQLSGGMYGGIAFLSNLMREILSFFLIPLLIKWLNAASCIAAAGATSEDTTLPMMMKYTTEEYVVLSVINGALCSAAVPVMITLCHQIFG